MNLDRRRLLELAGAAAVAATAGLAGCSEADDDSDPEGDDPDEDAAIDVGYADWLALDADDELVFAYADWSFLADADLENELEHETGEAEHEDSLTESEDVVLGGPVAGGVVVAFGAAFGLWGTGLSGLMASDIGVSFDDDADESFETAIDELLLVNDAYVLAGDVDTDEVHAELTAEPASEWDPKTAFERTSEIGSYDVYEPTADDSSQNTAIAVGADAIVVSSGDDGDDTIATLRGPIEAHLGDGPTAAEANDELAWLLSEAADGQLVFGGYGDTEADLEGEGDAEDEDDELADALGLVVSLSTDGDGLTGSFAATFETLDEDTEAELEAKIGSSANEVTLEIDGDRATASVSWDENLLE